MYKTNFDGQHRYEYVSKNFIRSSIFIPVWISFLIYLSYLSVGIKSIPYFYAMVGWIIFLGIFGAFSLLRQLIRQNKTITEIDFSDEDVLIKTDKILWLRGKEYKINKLKIHYRLRKFEWYGKRSEKVGLSIFVNNVELFLVKDYFDDYEDIIKFLEQ